MSLPWRMLTRRGRERELDHQARFAESRSRALKGIIDPYNNTLHHNNMLIESDSYHDLGIVCRDLVIDTDGSYTDVPKPAFFDPLAVSQIPTINTESDATRISLEDIMTIRKWRKTNPQYRSLSRQTRALGFEIGAAFRYHKRDEGRRKDRSLASIANYSQGGDISPDIIAEEYDPVIWQSLWWHPDAAFCQKTYLNLPHTMIVLQMTVELDDRIFQVEVLTALTIMLTLLEGDRFELHNTVPVMVISVMGRMQVRVLQFHYSREGLVVTKTRFMSFATDESTTIGLGVLMGLMSSKTSGNTKDPSNILKPVSPPTTPTQASSEPPVVDPNLTASRRILQALHVGKYSSRAKRSRSKTHGIPDFDPQPPNQISAPTHKAQEDTKEQKPPGSHFAYPEQLFTGPPD